MKTNFREIVVVEGNHDAAKLKAIYKNIDVIVTNGSEISEDTMHRLEQAQKKRGLILMLDPDYPGMKIRKTIETRVGPVKHIFLDKTHCIDKKKRKIGIEHAPESVLKKSLEDYVLEPIKTESHLEIKDLFSLGLSGTSNAALRRAEVAQYFHLGTCNSKTFLSRLNMFGISKADIERAIK